MCLLNIDFNSLKEKYWDPKNVEQVTLYLSVSRENLVIK